MKDETISVFFPAYNDGASIGRIVDDAITILESLNNDYEIIIVNDGSSDNTREVLDELKKKNNRIKIIHHLKNTGYGGALKAGFANCTKDLIFYTDGDGQYDVKDLPRLLSLMKDNVDVVNGYKVRRADSLFRIIMGRVYYWIARLVFDLKLKDITCDFRLMRRPIFDKIKLEYDSGAICVEMMKKIQNSGYRILDTPVCHYHRIYGKSQFFNLSNLLKMALELTKFWWKQVIKKG